MTQSARYRSSKLFSCARRVENVSTAAAERSLALCEKRRSSAERREQLGEAVEGLVHAALHAGAEAAVARKVCAGNRGRQEMSRWSDERSANDSGGDPSVIASSFARARSFARYHNAQRRTALVIGGSSCIGEATVQALVN